jgi:hypothetical protein
MTAEKTIQEIRERVNRLIQVEEEVAELTEKTINQAANCAIKYLLRAIQHDCRKHADWGRAALEIIENKKVVGLSEKKEVWDCLKKHADREEKQIELVAELRYLSKTAALQYIFEQIMDDEKKHHDILETLMTKRFEQDPIGHWSVL